MARVAHLANPLAVGLRNMLLRGSSPERDAPPASASPHRLTDGPATSRGPPRAGLLHCGGLIRRGPANERSSLCRRANGEHALTAAACFDRQLESWKLHRTAPHPPHAGARARISEGKSADMRHFCRALWRTRTADPLLTMGLLPATGGNPRQRIWPVLAVSPLRRFATDRHPLQPGGSIKVPSSVVGFGYATRAGRRASAAPFAVITALSSADRLLGRRLRSRACRPSRLAEPAALQGARPPHRDKARPDAAERRRPDGGARTPGTDRREPSGRGRLR
jgi:hypothetical protein